MAVIKLLNNHLLRALKWKGKPWTNLAFGDAIVRQFNVRKVSFAQAISSKIVGPDAL